MKTFDQLKAELIRVWYPPRKTIPKSLFLKQTPKQKWYRDQSVLRYCKDPRQKILFNAFAAFNGEIGKIDSFRFISSKEVNHEEKP